MITRAHPRPENLFSYLLLTWRHLLFCSAHSPPASDTWVLSLSCWSLLSHLPFPGDTLVQLILHVQLLVFCPWLLSTQPLVSKAAVLPGKWREHTILQLSCTRVWKVLFPCLWRLGPWFIYYPSLFHKNDFPSPFTHTPSLAPFPVSVFYITLPNKHNLFTRTLCV